MNESVVSTIVKGEDIQAFVNKLSPVMEGTRLDIAAAAMLTLIITNMVPTITSERLAESVTNVASYMVMYLSADFSGPQAVN